MASTLLWRPCDRRPGDARAATPWRRFIYSQIDRDDVIVFYKPISKTNGERIHLVKRVVGIPGDRIHLRDASVYVNGVAQIERSPRNQLPPDYNPYIDEFPSLPPSDADGATAEWSVVMPQYGARRRIGCSP